MGRMTLITGDERRRRWSDEERARILAAIEEPGAVVAEVARRADVCTSLVYKWRREARSAADASASGFARVVVEDLPPTRRAGAGERRARRDRGGNEGARGSGSARTRRRR